LSPSSDESNYIISFYKMQAFFKNNLKNF